MPIPTASRNNILAQLDAAFTALEAGDMEAINAMIHNSFRFSTGGQTYIAAVVGGGENSLQLLVRIEREAA